MLFPKYYSCYMDKLWEMVRGKEAWRAAFRDIAKSQT